MIPDGRVADSGEILEIEPQRRLVLTWRNEFKPEMRAEGYSRLTYELEPQGDSVKLTVIHEIEKPDSKLIEARVERLAAHPRQPQEPARNRRIARRNPPLAEGDVNGRRNPDCLAPIECPRLDTDRSGRGRRGTGAAVVRSPDRCRPSPSLLSFLEKTFPTTT